MNHHRHENSCFLCNGIQLGRISPANDFRSYLLCYHCRLIFADRNYLPLPDVEKERYSQHTNSINHEGYVLFLVKIINPALQILKTGMTGLDYGCGPNPTLSQLLHREGFACFNYDPIFGIDHPLEKYDFIFSTEPPSIFIIRV